MSVVSPSAVHAGAHGRGGAVWAQGDSAHAHQHQECPSVPGKTLQAAAADVKETDY